MLKYLRIAVTALSLTPCVLLIALWVGSYWWEDKLHGNPSKALQLGIVSTEGSIRIYTDYHRAPGLLLEPPPWRVKRYPVGYRNRPRQNNTWRWHRDDIVTRVNYAVHFPHWFAVLLLASLTALPWLPTFRWRFSLRTLLIATTLVAMVMGTVIYLAR